MMPKPWETAGLDQITYSKLPWPKKREWLIKSGHKPLSQVEIKALNEKIERDRPVGGYMFKAWCFDNAERYWFGRKI